MTFLEDLKGYLTAQGYDEDAIFRDTMPDQPDECIGLLPWDNPSSSAGVAASWRYVQIQVRRHDGDDAYTVAYALFLLLDSGQDGTKIQLAEGRVCTIRPRRAPKKMSEDANGRVVYYIEVAFWGLNKA